VSWRQLVPLRVEVGVGWFPMRRDGQEVLDGFIAVARHAVRFVWPCEHGLTSSRDDRAITKLKLRRARDDHPGLDATGLDVAVEPAEILARFATQEPRANLRRGDYRPARVVAVVEDARWHWDLTSLARLGSVLYGAASDE